MLALFQWNVPQTMNERTKNRLRNLLIFNWKCSCSHRSIVFRLCVFFFDTEFGGSSSASICFRRAFFMRCYSHLSWALSPFVIVSLAFFFFLHSLAFIAAFPLLILSLVCLLSFGVVLFFILVWYTLFIIFKCVISSVGFHKHIYFIAWRFAHSIFCCCLLLFNSQIIIVRFIVGPFRMNFETKERLRD